MCCKFTKLQYKWIDITQVWHINIIWKLDFFLSIYHWLQKKGLIERLPIVVLDAFLSSVRVLFPFVWWILHKETLLSSLHNKFLGSVKVQYPPNVPTSLSDCKLNLCFSSVCGLFKKILDFLKSDRCLIFDWSLLITPVNSFSSLDDFFHSRVHLGTGIPNCRI